MVTRRWVIARRHFRRQGLDGELVPEPRGWAWQFNGFTLYEAGRWQARWSYMEGVRYVSEDVAKLARKVLGLNPQETIIVEVVHGRS